MSIQPISISTFGEEFGINFGLNWIPGVVRKLQTTTNILPHIGWNNIKIEKKNEILNNIDDNSDFYFLNSFCFVPNDKKYVLASTYYDENFTSIINKDNIFGVQFHPEKSQKSGIQIISNFLKL